MLPNRGVPLGLLSGTGARTTAVLLFVTVVAGLASNVGLVFVLDIPRPAMGGVRDLHRRCGQGRLD
jgi:hypothetical protein